MAPHDSLLIDQALHVLSEVARDRSPGPKQSPCLKLALRVLLAHASQRYYIDQFWSFAGWEDHNSRSLTLQKIIAPLVRSVGRSGESSRP